MSQPTRSAGGRHNIVVLISGSGSNLQSIIDNTQNGNIADTTISCVLSNKADAFGLQRARQANIPTHVIDHRQFPDRVSFDQQMIQAIDSYNPELVILAGFMRILSEEFVTHYSGRLLNIHPSLLPKYKGLHTHRRALEDKQAKHGASVHYVTPELDSGAIIMQAQVDVLDGDDEEQLAARVLQQEHRLYPTVVEMVLRQQITLVGDHVLIDGDQLEQPLLLTDDLCVTG